MGKQIGSNAMEAAGFFYVLVSIYQTTHWHTGSVRTSNFYKNKHYISEGYMYLGNL
jgi:hypothetical protein